MSENTVQVEANSLVGAFVETAFTANEVASAIAAEETMGIKNTACIFLEESNIKKVSTSRAVLITGHEGATKNEDIS